MSIDRWDPFRGMQSLQRSIKKLFEDWWETLESYQTNPVNT